MGNEGKESEKRPDDKKRLSEPGTWPEFAARLAELVTESWDNVFRLSVFLLVLAIVLFAAWRFHGVIS